jgi:hypothetical protein
MDSSKNGRWQRSSPSDHHFGHSNIIRYSGRPHSSVGEMNLDLTRRWNEICMWPNRRRPFRTKDRGPHFYADAREGSKRVTNPVAV